MNYLTARTKIVIGLISLLISILFVALALGLVPDNRQAIMQGRAQFCEAVAISTSAFLSRNDQPAIDALLRAVVRRHPDLASAAVRRDGVIVSRAGEGLSADDSSLLSNLSTDTHVTVPVRKLDKPYGTIEFNFRAGSRDTAFGGIFSQRFLMITFIAGASYLAFLLYMRKMLQHLDPGKSVPKRVRSALDNLVSGLFVLDLNKRIVLANEAFAQRLGATTEELTGRTVDKLPWVAADANGATGFPWDVVLSTNAVQSNVMIRLRCSDEITRSFLVNCSPVLGQNGSPRGVLISLEDITELEKKEAELRVSRDEANQANSAKSEFLARMSHEIRTPLNAILGFADILRRGLATSDEERIDYLTTIHASGKHLLALINDILDLSKVEAGRLEVEHVKCSPHQLIRQVINELSVRSREKGIKLEYLAPGGLPQSIVTDPVRFKQLLINLIGNAIKFTEKGSVKVIARRETDGGKAKLAIDIIDTGIGMSPESVGKIFQPFVQADTSTTRRFGGTGLGLSICKRLAEALNGGITVKSELGKGSTFTLVVDPGDIADAPLVELDPSESVESSSESGEIRFDSSLPPARVLIADDGESNRKLIRLVLERAGLVVETAENGAQAVKFVESQRFDIILMDMNMPVMDGFTATRTLRAKGCKLPILAMTADAMKGSEEKCIAAGCSGFLTKPIDIDRVLRVVASTLGRKSISVPATHASNPIPVKSVEPQKENAQQQPAAIETPITTTLPIDDPVMCEIVAEFVDRLHQQLGAMKQAAAEDNLKQVAFLAHWLKGCGGTAGFDAFTAPAKHLETIAKGGDLAQVAAAIEEIQSLVDRVQRPAPPIEATEVKST